MADVVTKAKRSKMMSGIRSTNTRPEILVRKLLFAKGFRFRLHDRTLPGTPDLVLKKHRTVVFVHGCFWHGHNCPLFKRPQTRRKFWLDKIQRNQERDRLSVLSLRRSGWNVVTVWECVFKGRARLPLYVLSGRLEKAVLEPRERISVVRGRYRVSAAPKHFGTKGAKCQHST